MPDHRAAKVAAVALLAALADEEGRGLTDVLHPKLCALAPVAKLRAGVLRILRLDAAEAHRLACGGLAMTTGEDPGGVVVTIHRRGAFPIRLLTAPEVGGLVVLPMPTPAPGLTSLRQ